MNHQFHRPRITIPIMEMTEKQESKAEQTLDEPICVVLLLVNYPNHKNIRIKNDNA